MLTTAQIDYTKVAAECKLPTAGAAYALTLRSLILNLQRVSLTSHSNKRYSRWKTKVQAELANGGGASADGNDAGNGSESPKKGKKTPAKKTAAAGEGTPKKTPAESAAKATSAKKRRLDEDDEGAAEKVRGEPKEKEKEEVRRLSVLCLWHGTNADMS